MQVSSAHCFGRAGCYHPPHPLIPSSPHPLAPSSSSSWSQVHRAWPSFALLPIMTRGVHHIDTVPDIIPARVNIHHLQLRDLLQPTGVKDNVLFVSRLQVEHADFSNPLKPPSVYCTLDFQPNCLTTGSGLLAAGGQHGELAMRPLHPASLQRLDPSCSERSPAPWLLRTPTGGSINNAISIQPDLNAPSSSRAFASAASQASPTASKRDVVDAAPQDTYSPWARDEPSSSYSSNHARPGLLFGDEQMESELSQSVFEELAAAYGFDPASVNRSSAWRRSSPVRARRTSSIPSSLASAIAPIAPIKVMVSNNDQSIKLYKLRPPKSSAGTDGRIESGLPGLSRNTTLHFPTAINHSSLSPDQRTLIAVGDTPDVFIHSVSRSGEHVKVATYTASSDACFSTTWSPDGSKFAVASQDGVVSVWDVRSSRRLAALTASQASSSSGSGAARVVKFSPDGRFLAYTEHRNFFHVADTVTFEDVQRVAAPTVAPESSTWSERRIPLTTSMVDTDRFRLLTGQDAIARDRERRSMIHATFMREWNRAINLVDRGPSSDQIATSRGSNYFPDLLNWSPTSTATSSTPPTAMAAGATNISGLCWDPDSEAIFVATERAIAKHTVADTRISVANATLL